MAILEEGQGLACCSVLQLLQGFAEQGNSTIACEGIRLGIEAGDLESSNFHFHVHLSMSVLIKGLSSDFLFLLSLDNEHRSDSRKIPESLTSRWSASPRFDITLTSSVTGPKYYVDDLGSWQACSFLMKKVSMPLL